MKKENKILYWFIGTFLLPPMSWLLSAWYFDVWNTEEMLKILLRINIPAYVMVFATIIFFIVKHKINNISNYYKNPTSETLLKAQKSARFLPRFFMIILPIYTTLGDFPVLLPLDFIDRTEFLLGISIGVPVIFIFAIPFFIIMNKHLEEFTKKIPVSEKYKALSISNKMTILFLLSIIGISVFYISGVIGISYNNQNESLIPVFIEKLSIASAFIFGLTFLNLHLFKKEILLPIKNIRRSMFEIAKGEGDLTKRLEVNTRDELGQMSHWFNLFINNINKIILDIDKKASAFSITGNELALLSEKISFSAKQQSDASLGISQNANVQASTTEEVSASMHEMMASISENAKNAEYTNTKSKNTSEELQNSSEIILQTIDLVSKISDEIGLISGIAVKTDILAINAAIEAARAGEAGKGFAVVAQEIRKLAEESQIASEKIDKFSKNGKNISENARKALQNSMVGITESSRLINNIANTSREQENSVNLVNNAINQLTEITNKNSASSEEMSANADSLLTQSIVLSDQSKIMTSQSKELKDLISVFKID